MKKNILSIAFFATIILCYFSLSSNKNGKTGSSTSGCGSCHGNTAKTATIISTTFDGAPLTSYTPGQKYAVELTLSNSSSTLVNAGFDAAFTKGIISNAISGTNISTSKLEIYHSTPKNLTSGSVKWTFDWTAPAAGSGAVTLNIAGNVCNGNGQDDSGDAWNTATVSLAEATGTTSTPPTITNVSSSAITSNSATISAKVNANNSPTSSILVEYGTTTSYGSTKSVSPTSVTGTTATAISSTLSSLTANKTYHYRIKAVNAGGTTYSADSTFTTKTTNNIQINDNLDSKITFFPNPTVSHFSFINPLNQKIERITATDLKGVIKTLDFEIHNSDLIKVDVSNSAHGTYFITIHTLEKSIAVLQPIIVN